MGETMTDLRVTTMGTAFDEATVQALQASLRGALLRPGDEGYEAARRVRNWAIDRCPGLIVRCAGADDVIRAVNFARSHDLLVAVRGGGHSYAGHSTCDGGIVIDLSSMKGIEVDPERRVARAEAGLTLGEFDQATQAFGLVTPLGTVAETGIAGLTLGGGFGWLMGKYGLSCDNLLSVEVVTADARLLTASAQENEDLFWGVGGGSGNFVGGGVTYPVAQTGTVLRFFREFTGTAPDELTSYAGFLPSADGPVFGIFVCYCGDLEAGTKVLKPLRSFGRPVADSIRPMSYLEMQALLGAFFPPVPPLSFYVKAGFLPELSDGAIDTILAQVAKAPLPVWMSFLEHFHGAACRVHREETAFPHREIGYNIETGAGWQDPAAAPAVIAWVRGYAEALQPFSSSRVYVNRLGDEGEERVKAAYDANYARLVALKNKYDPTNFFHLNQNIKPMV
jgi:hypothetical protein